MVLLSNQNIFEKKARIAMHEQIQRDSIAGNASTTTWPILSMRPDPACSRTR